MGKRKRPIDTRGQFLADVARRLEQTGPSVGDVQRADEVRKAARNPFNAPAGVPKRRGGRRKG